MTGRAGLVAAVMIIAAAGCSPAAEPTPPPSSATYPLDPRPVRPEEVPLRLPPVRDGDTEFTLIGLTTKTPSLTGSHAEMKAQHGQYVRIRLVIVNTGRSGVPFNPRRQQLVLGDGSVHTPDPQAMDIKRQPSQFDLGANVRVEFDLYYDVAADAEPAALRVFGGPTLFDGEDAEGTDVKLP